MNWVLCSVLCGLDARSNVPRLLHEGFKSSSRHSPQKGLFVMDGDTSVQSRDARLFSCKA